MSKDIFKHALHIIGNYSTAGIIRQTYRMSRDQVLINEDELGYGPAPVMTDLKEWRIMRERYVATLHKDWPDFSFDVDSGLGLLMNAERLNQKRPVVIWAGRGLADQLFLAWVVFLHDYQGIGISHLHIISFKNWPSEPNDLRLSYLNPEDILQYRPVPRPLQEREIQELRRAWTVYTSSDPVDLIFYANASSPMPLLHQAMCRLIHRYPDIQSGLSHWDFKLLNYANEKGPKALRVIGHTLGSQEADDGVGVGYLFDRLLSLARSNMTSQLVLVTGDITNERACRVKLTDFGREVLAGKANHVSVNGIDDWIGGVHLRTDHPVTFRKGDELILPD